MTTLNKIKAIITVIVIILPVFLQAQDNTFNGTTDNNWDEAANWSIGKVPPANIVQKITIAADCEVPASNSTNYTFAEGSTFQINSGITFTNNGTGTWTMGGTFDKDGTYIGDLVISGDIEPGTNVSSWACGDPLVYGGQSYNTVQICGQCWMAENLNIGTTVNENNNQTNNNVIEKYCDNCNTYGGLYQWDEMMQYVTVESTQGICPTGWHIPSDDEWKTLEMKLGMSQSEADGTGYRGTNEGSKMAGNASLWPHGALENAPEFNTSGLAIIPAGYRRTNGSFYFRGSRAKLWSSSESGSLAWYRFLYYHHADVYRLYDYDKAYGFSVRCVRACTPPVPSCTSLTSPLNGSDGVDVSANLEWAAVSNVTGYKLTVGTSSGGTDILDNLDVGNVTIYDPEDFPFETTIFVTITPYNSNFDAVGCSEESFTTAAVAFVCGYPFVYDGQSYNTVQIGGQCWMAENLNIGTTIDGDDEQTNNNVIEKYCYDNDPDNCDIYGGLYQWDEMMQYVTVESTHGVCPTGWHIPSDDEWKTLEMELGMSQSEADDTGWRGTNEGSKMAGNAGLWHDGALENDPEFNTSGLIVLPAGYRPTNGSFYFQSYDAILWSSSVSGSYAWDRHLYYDDMGVYRNYYYSRAYGFSVRCVRD